MNFDELYNLTTEQKGTGTIKDRDGKILVEFQPQTIYRNQIDGALGRDILNQFNMVKPGTMDRIARSRQQYEELMSKAKNVLPFQLQRVPEEVVGIYETLVEIIKQYNAAYTDVTLNQDEKKALQKNVKRFQAIQTELRSLMDELSSLEK